MALSLVQGCFADFARSDTGAAGSGSAGAGAAASGAAGARAAGAGADGAAATETGAAGAGDAGTGDAGAGRLLCYFHIRNRFEETLQNKCFKNYGDTDRDYHYFDVWNLLCEAAKAKFGVQKLHPAIGYITMFRQTRQPLTADEFER